MVLRTTPFVVALVATCNRPELLMERCLRSISQQLRSPDLVVVIDDSPHEKQRDENRKAVEAFRAQSGLEVITLANQRTKGASGAWNTGILRALATDGVDPAGTFIAILDDDDEWLPEHLQRCLQIAEDGQANFIAAGFERYEGEDRPKVRVIPPAMPTREDFFRGNPGIQGSNLFVRLDRLLAAGLFDEGMPSCTDRDLCIRLLDVEGTRYGRTTVPTVIHFAESSRDRLSKPLSRTKSVGLEQFFRKYSPRMTEEVRRHALQRARRLFQWEPEAEDGELSAHKTLRDWVHHLRRSTIDRDGVLRCDPLPLFVVLAHFLSENALCDAFTEAIRSGIGDPEDLEPRDAAQTSRLEAAVLHRTEGLLAMRELISVSWWDCDSGPRSISVCVAYTPEDGLLVLQDHDACVSFQVVALGCERALQAVVADNPELILPRLAAHDASLHDVVVRYDATWTLDDLAAIVHAITGVTPTTEHVLRADLLHQPT